MKKRIIIFERVGVRKNEQSMSLKRKKITSAIAEIDQFSSVKENEEEVSWEWQFESDEDEETGDEAGSLGIEVEENNRIGLINVKHGSDAQPLLKKSRRWPLYAVDEQFKVDQTVK